MEVIYFANDDKPFSPPLTYKSVANDMLLSEEKIDDLPKKEAPIVFCWAEEEENVANDDGCLSWEEEEAMYLESISEEASIWLKARKHRRCALRWVVLFILVLLFVALLS